MIIPLIVFMLLYAGTAQAADASAVSLAGIPADHIAVLPIYQFAEPYILTAFGVVVSILLSWGLAQLQTRTGIKVTADARERIQTAATNAAGRILAAQEGNLAHVSFPAGSPVIAAQVPKIEAAAADAVKHLGMTPERIGDLIAGKIGQLQAAATVTTTAVPPATARGL